MSRGFGVTSAAQLPVVATQIVTHSTTHRIFPTRHPKIIAPFDTSARFRFYALNADVAQDTLPTDINNVRGLELVLAGSANEALTAEAQKKQATMVTGVFFKNRRDP